MKFISGLRKFIGNLIRLSASENSTFSILSGPLRGARWFVHSGALGYLLGTYEKGVQNSFKLFIREGDVVFDIGAHAGFYSLLASRLTGSSGRVFAFEPNPKNIFYLQKNLKVNSCPNVEVIKGAVSDVGGKKKFYEGDNSAAGALIPLDFKPRAEIETDTISLDEEILKNKIPPPDFIKIDVEGEEWRVLRGAGRVIEKFKPCVVVSVHGKDLAKNCIDFFLSLGYKTSSIDGSSLDSVDGGEILARFRGS